MATPKREILIQGYVPWAYDVMYAAFLVAGIVMVYGLNRHLMRYGIGRLEFLRLTAKDAKTKVARLARFGLGQERVLDDAGGGVMHGAIFYGFLMLFIYTSLIFLQNDILPVFTSYNFMQGDAYLTLELLGDAFGLAFIVGLMIAIYRRYVKKLEKLHSGLDDFFVIGMLVWIGVSGFLIEAVRLVVVPVSWAEFSPVGDTLARAISALGGLQASGPGVYQVLWFAHMFSVMFLIAATPYTKLVHVFTSGLNVAVAPVKPMGKLSTPFSLPAMLASGQFEIPASARTVGALAPLQLLALDACTNCGRCEEVCPAHASGRDLSPRALVTDLKSELTTEGRDVFGSGAVREDELWACTMCNACVSVCPVFIDQVGYVTDYRRTLVAESKLDGKKKIFLESVGRYGNPFGLPPEDRMSWLTSMGVPTLRENPSAEYLYWVGCQSAYDPRARKVAEAVVKVLKAGGVDFAVLGPEETCTGEPVRRMGEEGRFQELVLKNLETFKAHGVRKVVVHCPHCFNTFKNEYPEFGAGFEVVHHTELIARLIDEGKIKPGKLAEKVTYHDPCNLGRMNGVFEAPREVLRSMDGAQLAEMGRARMKSFCCGGGGANVWYEVPEKKKIGVIRAEEAMKTGAETLAVACPFCITMFEDATKAMGEDSFRVRDVAELLAESME